MRREPSPRESRRPDEPRRPFLALFLGTIAVLSFGCGSAGSVAVDPSSATLAVGESVQLTATVNGVFSFMGSTVFSSSNPHVAVVDGQGLVTAENPGTAQIYVSRSGNGALAEVALEVVAGRDEGALVISEVGTSTYYSSETWVEVYNRSTQPVELSNYTLRTTARNATNTDTYREDVRFPLDTAAAQQAVLEPGSYLVIAARTEPGYMSVPGLLFVENQEGFVPNWSEDDGGFVELLRDGSTVDFVVFGARDVAPTSDGAWSGDPAIDTPEWEPQYRTHSLTRSADLRDTNTASDWRLKPASTPGGANDVTTVTDEDRDGIPDANEQPGSTYAGLPLHEWGARPGTPDIFLQITYMETDIPGVVPRRSVLDRLVSLFAREGFALHIDVGDLYHASPGIAPEDYDLSDRDHAVPHADCVSKDGAPDCADFYEIKYVSMPLARKSVFHFALQADQRAPPDDLTTRLSETGGNDFITYYYWAEGRDTSDPEQDNYVENVSSSYILFGLGRNFGLRPEGGDGDQDYKPNYISTMNYLYDGEGLPPVGTSAEGDRYYERYELNGYSTWRDLQGSPYGDPSAYRIGFSHGTGNPIDENQIDEAAGLGRGNSAPVDFDGDGNAGEILSGFDVNSDDPSGTITVLRDYDDWGNIDLLFGRDAHGVMSIQRHGNVVLYGSDRGSWEAVEEDGIGGRRR